MTTALPTLLQPRPLMKTVSRLRVRNTRLQDLFGMGLPAWPGDPASPSAKNVEQYSGRNFAYDVFNDTRAAATARIPGQTSARVAPQNVGNVTGAFPRIAETLPLLDEKIHNLRPIGGPTGALDRAGESYIVRQERYLKQRIVNAREFQVAAMMRGSYTYTVVGDSLFHDFSGGTQTINFRVPAGNLTQLNMLAAGDIIGTSWDNAAAPILGDLASIEAAFQQLHGIPLWGVIVNSVGMANVLDNTGVKNRSGSSSTPYEEYREIDGTNDFFIRLKAKPELKWFVVNETLDLGSTPTTTKLIADTQATFIPEPTPDWIAYWEGSEMVSELANNRRAEQFGSYFWAERMYDPSGYELKTIHNGIPALFVPAAIATGTVVF